MSWEQDLGIGVIGASIGAVVGASIGGYIALRSAIKQYFFKINDDKQRNAKSILDEIKAIQEKFQGAKDLEDDVLEGDKTDGSEDIKINYYRVTIPVISFNGVLNSGGMALFDENLSRRLRYFYGSVEAHNHYYESIVRRREDLIIQDKFNALYNEIVGPYAESLTIIDDHIIGMCNVLIPQLEEE